MLPTTTRLAALAALLLPLASATLSFNTSIAGYDGSKTDFSIPHSWGISDACAAAYAAEIPCDSSLTNPSVDETLNSTLEKLCTNECIDGFRKWRDDIRAECSTTDIKAAASKLRNVGDSMFDSDGPEGALMLTSIANESFPMVEYMYWQACTRDLKTGDLCMLDDSYMSEESWQYNKTSLNTPEGTAIFCADTCLTQASVLAYDISSMIFGDEGISIGNVAVLCPDVDTSKYPIILSESPASSFSFSSSGSSASPSATSSGATGSPTGTATNGTVEPGTNAAGSLKGSLWGLGSSFVAVAVAVFVF